MNKSFFQKGVLFVFSIVLCGAVWLVSYNYALGFTVAQALANNIKWKEANSLLYMTSQEKAEYKLYVLDGGMDAADFQFFDEWKEHRVFKLTLSDLEELN